MPIALAGVIAGGGIRPGRAGMLGVFLRHDPEDFGLRRRPLPPPSGSRMRTALSDAAAADDADDSYGLAWMSQLPATTSGPSPSCASRSPRSRTS